MAQSSCKCSDGKSVVVIQHDAIFLQPRGVLPHRYVFGVPFAVVLIMYYVSMILLFYLAGCSGQVSRQVGPTTCRVETGRQSPGNLFIIRQVLFTLLKFDF